MSQRETLPGIFMESHPHRPVVRTSVLAHQAHGGFKGRKADTLEALRRWDFVKPWKLRDPFPTSAELAASMADRFGPDDYIEARLFVRRGLSDLKACGAVEHGPERKCRVTGERCKTWRVVTR